MTVDDAEHAWRRCAPDVLAAVVRRHGDFDTAEDAVQEALLAAARQWPEDGVPDDPRAWLITVASRRMVDQRRRDRARRDRERLPVGRLATDDIVAPSADSGDPGGHDDSLALLLLCCHPELTPPSQVALTLRAVAGLSTAQIARVFLVPEATMAQRISRAKSRLRKAGVRFGVLEPAELPGRVTAVLQVLYLAFTEGHTSTSGTGLQDVEPGGAGQVVRDRPQHRPGGVRGERSGG